METVAWKTRVKNLSLDWVPSLSATHPKLKWWCKLYKLTCNTVGQLSALSVYLIRNSIEVALVQELWTHNWKIKCLKFTSWTTYWQLCERPRAFIVIKDDIKWTPLWELCCSDLVAAISEGGNVRKLALGSANLPYDQPGPWPMDEWRLVVGGEKTNSPF